MQMKQQEMVWKRLLRRGDWMLAGYDESRYRKPIIERLGNALYWASRVISGLALLAAVAGAVFGHGRHARPMIHATSAIAAKIAMAKNRYVLAGT